VGQKKDQLPGDCRPGRRGKKEEKLNRNVDSGKLEQTLRHMAKKKGGKGMFLGTQGWHPRGEIRKSRINESNPDGPRGKTGKGGERKVRGGVPGGKNRSECQMKSKPEKNRLPKRELSAQGMA